jgi:hypothetical protein
MKFAIIPKYKNKSLNLLVCHYFEIEIEQMVPVFNDGIPPLLEITMQMRNGLEN